MIESGCGEGIAEVCGSDIERKEGGIFGPPAEDSAGGDLLGATPASLSGVVSGSIMREVVWCDDGMN